MSRFAFLPLFLSCHYQLYLISTPHTGTTVHQSHVRYKLYRDSYDEDSELALYELLEPDADGEDDPA